MQSNIHYDQDVAKSYNFKGDAKYPAESSNFFMKIRNPWLRLTDCKKYHFSFYQVDPVWSCIAGAIKEADWRNNGCMPRES